MPTSSEQTKELFLKAIDLEGEERDLFLKKIDDPDLKKEVSSLVNNHIEDFTIAISQPLQPIRKKKIAIVTPILKALFGNKFKFVSTMFLVSILISVLGFISYQKVKKELVNIHTKQITNTLKANNKALEIWIDEQKKLAHLIAEAPKVRNYLIYLTKTYGFGKDAPQELIVKDPSLLALNDWIKPIINSEGIVEYSVLDKTGYRVASNNTESIGQQISQVGVNHLLPVFTGKNFTFTLPADPKDNMVWLDVPLSDTSGKVFATLGFGYDISQEFNKYSALVSPGNSGNTYSYNSEGQIMFPFVSNGNLRNSKHPAAITLLNKEKHQTKILLSTYNSLNGAPVIGGYLWIPKFKTGLIAELPDSEAFKSLKSVGVTFTILVLLILLIALVSLFNTFRWLKLKEKSQQVVGPYLINDKIGEGGMGNIYLAEHKLLKRLTAIKTLKRESLSAKNKIRFENEALLASKLNHPNTVKIYDYGVEKDGNYYFAMEYLEGITINQLIDISGPVNKDRSLHIILQICYSLREAHHKNLIHRDIKPQNIMLCYFGDTYDFVKVLDFGLVKDLDREQGDELTTMFEIGGTPMYMSPERLTAPSTVNQRTDIYSVGAVAYFLLTGLKPFHKGVTDLDTINHVLNESPTLIVNPNIDKALEDIIHKCLEKEPENRYNSIEELICKLEGLMTTVWSQEKAKEWWNVNLSKYLK